MALRTGIAIATIVIKHLCNVLRTYRPAMNGVIGNALSAGHITSVQRDILYTWLDGAQTACDIIRLVSGY